MAELRGPSSKIEMRVLRSHQTASVRETVRRDDMTEALGRIYRAVNEAIATQGAQTTGSPFARFHTFGATLDLEAGVPVDRAIRAAGDVKPSTLPAGPAALAVHAGPYEGLSATYDAISSWIERTGRAASGAPWEIYLTDPSTEPDPTRWLTEVIWPIQP